MKAEEAKEIALGLKTVEEITIALLIAESNGFKRGYTKSYENALEIMRGAANV
jgi:hypothetical protein